MVSDQWPYPGDSPIAKARRIAAAYRAIAEAADPGHTNELDRRVLRWGETWAVPTYLTYDDDDWLPAAAAAELACVQEPTLRQWRARGHIQGRRRGRATEYRAGDIVSLFSVSRGRGRSVTDTLSARGSSVPTDDS